jgi:hypothetical protein
LLADRDGGNLLREQDVIQFAGAAELDQRQAAQSLRSRRIRRPARIVKPDFQRSQRARHARRIIAVRQPHRVADGGFDAHLARLGLADAAHQPGVNDFEYLFRDRHVDDGRSLLVAHSQFSFRCFVVKSS